MQEIDLNNFALLLILGFGMFELFGKKEFSPKALYSIHTELHPYSLKSHKSDFVDLEVTLTNNSNSELLTALVVVVPQSLGFERSAISHEKEVRLGYLPTSQPKHLKIPLWGNERTEKGVYTISLYAISHYNDYGHVLNQARRTIDLRVE